MDDEITESGKTVRTHSGSAPLVPVYVDGRVGGVGAAMTSDPAILAAEYKSLKDQIETLEASAQEIRDRLKGILLGEATAPPEGGWVYGPVTVQYVKASERTSINRKKLVQQGVSLEQIEASMDVTKMAPTIRVVKTAE